MESCLYEGRISHRRFAPIEHAFDYRIFLTYLDLAELPKVFDGSWLWSAKRFTVARFRRDDHLGNPKLSLDEAVRSYVEEQTGKRPAGPIRLLTHLRYFGYGFNPVSFYFCFGANGRDVEVVVGEVSNTPWGERHCYVLHDGQPICENQVKTYRFPKKLHVSPFMGMDMEYRCIIGCPGETLVVQMEDWQDGSRIFDATLTLRRKQITGRTLLSQLVRYPFMPQRVIQAIYWQALLLWWKGARYYPHPKHRRTEQEGK